MVGVIRADSTRSIHKEIKKRFQNLVRESYGKWQLTRPAHRWEDSIKTNFR